MSARGFLDHHFLHDFSPSRCLALSHPVCAFLIENIFIIVNRTPRGVLSIRVRVRIIHVQGGRLAYRIHTKTRKETE